MSAHQLKDEKYSLKGSTQCSDEYGVAKRNQQVLAGAANGGQFAQGDTPNHAQVVLKEGSGASAKPIAFFSAEQARRLAQSLTAAADATGADIKADC